jgi:uncharacterized iron-regulated membrane protein
MVSPAHALTASDKARQRRSGWLDHPQRTRLRKVLVKVHLWTALGLSLYLVVICVSGSAVVMRREFSRWFSPPRFVDVLETRLDERELRRAIAATYPEHTLAELRVIDEPRLPVSATLELDNQRIERRFDPYTGNDLGDPFPTSLRIVEWLVDLHDNLLIDQAGRTINGVAGGIFLLLILTGAIIWWPGRARWIQSLTVSRKLSGYRFLWRLHSSLGFWSFALLFIWATTALYFAFPTPVESLIDWMDSDLSDFERPGEGLLRGMIAGHFGRFGPLPVRFVWITLGLMPIVLFVTGFLLWWKRRNQASARRRAGV